MEDFECWLVGLFNGIMLSVAITLLIISAKEPIWPIEDCSHSMSEARVEDEVCDMWFDNDKIVVGPAWLNPSFQQKENNK